MDRSRRILLCATAAFVLLSGCGGGGSATSQGGPAAVLPSKMLSWVAPAEYTDGSPLSPATELDVFEIYVNETGTFSESEVPDAYVAAVNQSNGQVITSFDLANLSPFISRGVTYHVAVRAVALTGTKSGFSGSATFSY